MENFKDESQPDPDMIFIDIPAVMLSTWDHPSYIEETFSKGADLYVQKPSSFSGFVLLLNKMFFLHWAKALLAPVRNLFFVSEKNISQGDS